MKDHRPLSGLKRRKTWNGKHQHQVIGIVKPQNELIQKYPD
jgi:hypothetical protein